MSNDFTIKVLNIVSSIPRGKFLTYAEVAQRAGSPRAYRAVGNILHRNFRAEKSQLPHIRTKPVPCHRVIRSNGFIGGYALGNTQKEKILQKEGFKIKEHRIYQKSPGLELF